MIREGGRDLSTKKTKPMARKPRSHVRMLIYRMRAIKRGPYREIVVLETCILLTG